jgi:hypothetical protein
VGTEIESKDVGRFYCGEVEVDSDTGGKSCCGRFWLVSPRSLQNPHEGRSDAQQFLTKQRSLDAACHHQIDAEPIRETYHAQARESYTAPVPRLILVHGELVQIHLFLY